MMSLNSLATVPLVLAQESFNVLLQHLVAVVVFSLVGVIVLGACFWIMKKMMPFSVTKEIEEDQNTALAIIIGSVIIGMSIIIAAAIHG